jgi:hypothetical protein
LTAPAPPRSGDPHRPPGPSHPGGSGAARGILLIAAAVIVGLVLLGKGLDDGGGTSAATGGGKSTTTTAASSQPTTSTTAAPQPHQPAQVKVLVANGANITGAASTANNTLIAKGYNALSPTNSPNVSTTTVYFAPGYQADATAIAQLLGAPAAGVQAMPAPPPLDVKGASVLVVLGPDVAKKK